MQHLEQRDPHDRLLERRDPSEAPALRVALDVAVEVFGVVVGGVRQRAREGRRVALEEVVERPAGQVLLVEGEDGGAPLVAALGHRLWVEATAARGRATRATCTRPSAYRPSPAGRRRRTAAR